MKIYGLPPSSSTCKISFSSFNTLHKMVQRDELWTVSLVFVNIVCFLLSLSPCSYAFPLFFVFSLSVRCVLCVWYIQFLFLCNGIHVFLYHICFNIWIHVRVYLCVCVRIHRFHICLYKCVSWCIVYVCRWYLPIVRSALVHRISY